MTYKQAEELTVKLTARGFPVVRLFDRGYILKVTSTGQTITTKSQGAALLRRKAIPRGGSHGA